MKKYLNLIIVIISLATVISGVAQVLAPRFVLSFIGAAITPTTAQFFATIGMFMTFFGCLMLHTIYQATPNPPAILWCAFQKLGASVAVGIGIINEIFTMPAAGVALFDLCSGILFLYYIKFIKSGEIG